MPDILLYTVMYTGTAAAAPRLCCCCACISVVHHRITLYQVANVPGTYTHRYLHHSSST